jgi:transposase
MSSGKERERELIIKLHKEKKTCRDIASLLGISKSKASYWINKSSERNSLADLPRSGRPTVLSQSKIELVYASLREADVSNKKAGFSSKKASDILFKVSGKKYTLRHVRRILKKMNIGLITPRVSHIRKDEKKIAEFKQQFKKNSNRNMWTTSL